MNLIRVTYPHAPEHVLARAEALFATWRSHLAGRKAEGLPGRYPSDDVLAEMVIDMVLQEQRGAEDALKKSG